MNYIYDILINFNPELYDYFEWNINDNISHVRKIPLFKVNSITLSELINNQVKVDSSFIKKIYNKSELFNKGDINLINYACIMCDENEAIAFKFNKNGLITDKSKLLLDEEEDARDLCMGLAIAEVTYEVIKSNNPYDFRTRKEREIIKYLKKEIAKIENEDEKLSYLYLECFGKRTGNKMQIMHDITNALLKNEETVYLKLYDFFKITNKL